MAGTVLSQELLEERLQEARRTYKLNVGWVPRGRGRGGWSRGGRGGGSLLLAQPASR